MSTMAVVNRMFSKATVHPGMTREEYDALTDHVNASSLRILATKKACNVQHVLKERAESDAMGLGALAHALVLDGLDPATVLVPIRTVKGETVRIGSRDTEAYRKLKAEHPRALIAVGDELQKAVAMRDILFADPWAKVAMTGAEFEVSITAIHNDTGLPIKARLDIANDLRVLDYKTARSGDFKEFRRSVWWNDRLDVQMALYCDLWCAAKRIINVEPGWIVQDNTAPHSLAFWTLTESQYERGRDSYCELLAEWKGHLEKGWPTTYTNGFEYLEKEEY